MLNPNIKNFIKDKKKVLNKVQEYKANKEHNNNNNNNNYDNKYTSVIINPDNTNSEAVFSSESLSEIETSSELDSELDSEVLSELDSDVVSSVEIPSNKEPVNKYSNKEPVNKYSNKEPTIQKKDKMISYKTHNPTPILKNTISKSQNTTENSLLADYLFNIKQKNISWGIPGPKGPMGIRGPVGPIGLRGPRGNIGPTGVEGPRGLKGEQGMTGPQGIRGSTGLRGPTGNCINCETSVFVKQCIIGILDYDVLDYEMSSIICCSDFKIHKINNIEYRIEYIIKNGVEINYPLIPMIINENDPSDNIKYGLTDISQKGFTIKFLEKTPIKTHFMVIIF